MITELLTLTILGLSAGFIGSILGLGGGIIVTPFLTLIYGLDIKYAISTSIIVVIATSSGSAISYLKDNILNLRAAMFLEIFTTSGGICGAIITGIIAPKFLYIIFSLLLLISLVNMIKKTVKNKNKLTLYTKENKLANILKLNSSYYDKDLRKNINYKVTNVSLGSAIMFGAGLASGLLGIGSGIFKVIAMDTAMKMPLKPSSSTSNLMMGVTAASSAIVYFFNGQIIPKITVVVSIAVIIGATVGSKIMPKLNNNFIRIVFIITLSIMIVQMICKAFLI